jgi:hypothetical protein
VTLAIAAGVTAAALLAAVLFTTRSDPTPAAATSAATTTTLPQACADALALADDLAANARPLAEAAVEHVVIMDRLDLYLEGKPGGLNGEQVYRLGDKQMEVMEQHAPDAQVRARRYQKVRNACPLK